MPRRSTDVARSLPASAHLVAVQGNASRADAKACDCGSCCGNVADNLLLSRCSAAVISVLFALLLRQNEGCFNALSRFQKKSDTTEQRPRGNFASRVSGVQGRVSEAQPAIFSGSGVWRVTLRSPALRPLERRSDEC